MGAAGNRSKKINIYRNSEEIQILINHLSKCPVVNIDSPNRKLSLNADFPWEFSKQLTYTLGHSNCFFTFWFLGLSQFSRIRGEKAIDIELKATERTNKYQPNCKLPNLIKTRQKLEDKSFFKIGCSASREQFIGKKANFEKEEEIVSNLDPKKDYNPLQLGDICNATCIRNFTKQHWSEISVKRHQSIAILITNSTQSLQFMESSNVFCGQHSQWILIIAQSATNAAKNNFGFVPLHILEISKNSRDISNQDKSQNKGRFASRNKNVKFQGFLNANYSPHRCEESFMCQHNSLFIPFSINSLQYYELLVYIVPRHIELLCNFVEHNCQYAKFLYRKSVKICGAAESLSQLFVTCTDSQQFKLEESRDVELLVLQSCEKIKLFFRKQSKNLFTETFVKLIEEEKIFNLNSRGNDLENFQISLLLYLLNHLIRVARKQANHKMSLESLVKVWCPIVMAKQLRLQETRGVEQLRRIIGKIEDLGTNLPLNISKYLEANRLNHEPQLSSI